MYGRGWEGRAVTDDSLVQCLKAGREALIEEEEEAGGEADYPRVLAPAGAAGSLGTARVRGKWRRLALTAAFLLAAGLVGLLITSSGTATATARTWRG